MNLLNKIFGKQEEDLMDFAPYLAPWYLDKDKPLIIKDGAELHWRRIEVGSGHAGVIVLEDKQGNCYGILDMNTYILSSSDNRSFLIWCRTLDKISGLQPIKLYYYNADNLQPFADSNKAIFKLKELKQPFAFSVDPTNKLKIEFNPTEDAMKYEFPDDFKKFGEFILITEMQNLYNNPNPENSWHNTTMLEFKAAKGWIFNYPQDWFNKSNCDFGYQWITRAIRNPETNLIHGQGIRISDFILDSTNKKLQTFDKNGWGIGE